MSKTVSMRLTEAQLGAVGRLGRRLNQRSTSATLQLLLEEKLREEAHTGIAFRDTEIGRQAYLAGTRLAVWQVMQVAREFGGDSIRTADYFEIPVTLAQAAQAYADHYPDEIQAALDEDDAIDFETLRRLLPNLEHFEVPSTSVQH